MTGLTARHDRERVCRVAAGGTCACGDEASGASAAPRAGRHRRRHRPPRHRAGEDISDPDRRVFTEKRSLIIPLIVGIVVNIALYAIVVYPLSKKVAGGEDQARASSAALEAARHDHAAARAMVEGKGQADEELSRFYTNVLPPDIGGARRITFLRMEQLARQCNLRLERGRPIRSRSAIANW